MIDILLPEKIARYDLSKPPGPDNPTAGMGVKYARVEEALRQRYPDARRVWEIEKVKAETVIVDPVWFRCATEGPPERMAVVEKFIQHGFKRVLLAGSEQFLMVFPDEVRQALMPHVTWVTHNSTYQQNALRSRGIYHSEFLCDPVPDAFFPAEKVPRVYTASQISWEKCSHDLIKVYAALQYTDIETVYVGSATMWGENVTDTELATRYRLQTELRAVCDVFLGNAPASEVAEWGNAAMHHLMVSQHDCSAQSQQEAALAGCLLWGTTHPLNGERPVYQFNTVDELIDALRSMDTKAYKERAEQIREHALKRWSYAAFLNQFEEILRRR